MTDLITGRVRAVFRDAVSQRMVLREIDRIWQAEGFAPGTTTFLGGQRVTLWAEYEASVDWASLEHIRRVLRVYESFLIEFGGDDITPFTRVLELDGFSVDPSRKITMVGGALSSLSGLDGLRDASGIRDAFRRIELLLDSDPAGVVGAVKELIEATAKTVLEHPGGDGSQGRRPPCAPDSDARRARTVGVRRERHCGQLGVYQEGARRAQGNRYRDH